MAESQRSESIPCPDCGEPMVVASRSGDEGRGDNEFTCENADCPAKKSRPRD